MYTADLLQAQHEIKHVCCVTPTWRSSVDILHCLRKEDFIKIQNRPDLKKTRAILKAYNEEGVFPKGEVYLDIQIGGKITIAKFLVIDDALSSLLSGKTCEEL